MTDSRGGSRAVSATQQLSLTINPAPLTITTTSLSNGVVGTAYSASVVASGGTLPYTWSITSGSLPGRAVTQPLHRRDYRHAHDRGHFELHGYGHGFRHPTADREPTLSITINPLLAITTASLPNGVVSTAYSATLQVTGGVGAITWSVPPEVCRRD